MTKLFLSLVLFLSTSTVIGQVVSSSCTAHDSIVEKYEYHAAQLALRRIYSEGFPTQFDEIIASESRDSIMQALIAVYNATSVPARDTVVAFDIYPTQEVGMRWIDITADSNSSWMQELLDFNQVTGNTALDDLISTYAASVVYASNPPWSIYAIARLELNDYYNLPLVVDNYSLDTLTGFTSINLISGGLDSDDLYYEVFKGYRQLNYVHKWGDCPSGCTYSRTYSFNVYPNCSVEYLGSYGDPYASISEIKYGALYVNNPVIDHLIVYNDHQAIEDYSYSIYNSQGQVAIEGFASDKKIDCSKLENGIYFIQFSTNRKDYILKVLKF